VKKERVKERIKQCCETAKVGRSFASFPWDSREFQAAKTSLYFLQVKGRVQLALLDLMEPHDCFSIVSYEQLSVGC
jgi:hypothetical protein